MTLLQQDETPVAEIPIEEWSDERIDCALGGSPYALEPWFEALLPWRSVGFPDARLMDRHFRECLSVLLRLILIGAGFFAFACAPDEPIWNPSYLPLVTLECSCLIGAAALLLPLLLGMECLRVLRPPVARIVGAAMLTLGGYAVLLAILAPVRWMMMDYSLVPALRVVAFIWVAVDVIPRVCACCGVSRFAMTVWLGAVSGVALLLISWWAMAVTSGFGWAIRSGWSWIADALW